jgi:nucleotide-binding universal stress UspA family protein
VFFALAGAQVDLREIANLSALQNVLELLVVATVVKIGLVALGARLGGFRGARSWLVGVGLNAKGGTDVVVAIVGHELGLLPSSAYTSYTVVAIITVLFTPALMRALERRTPPSGAEEERLLREEAAARAYTSSIERVLLPVVEQLRPTLARDVVEGLSLADERRLRTLDVTQLRPAGDDSRLADGIVSAATRHDLVVIGAEAAAEPYVFGPLADTVVHRSPSDVLVAVGCGQDRVEWPAIRRIVVPTNGLVHASAAADIAGLLAQQVGAEIVLLHVAPLLKPHAASAAHLDDVRDLLRRLDVEVTTRVRRGTDTVTEVLAELREPSDGRCCDLVVIGAVDRGRGARPFLGHTVEGLLADAPVPMVVLVTGRPAAPLSSAA